MSFTIGSTIGQYKIVEKLGRGGMATVYKARHTRLKRDVAIKVLHPTLNDDDSFLRRFDREAQLVAQLEHPHIVPVYDFAEHEGQPYLVMRLVEGDTLKERMGQGTLSRDEILRIAQAVADGLDYAHGQGVLHRDIKPSNIMLTSASGVYITDFGLARMVQAGESTLSQDMIMGTPQYISPEQAMGNKELDGRTDLYSFAIILYELVTGQPPFQSETTYSIIHMQIFDEPPLPNSLNENITPEMEVVLLKALSKEPDARYPTGHELLKAFRMAFETMPEDFAPTGAVILTDFTPVGATRVQSEPEPETAVPPLPEITTEVEPDSEPVEEPPTKKKRSKWTVVGAIAILIFLCSALAFGASQLRERRQDRQTEISEVQPADQNPNQLVDERPPVEEPLPEKQEPAPPDRPVFNPPPREIRPVEELEAELAEKPNDKQLKAELAVAYLHEGNPGEARALVSDLFSRIRLPHQFINTIDRLLETENYALAALVAQEGMSRFREDPELQHRLIMAMIYANTEPEIVEEYINIVSESPSPPSEINANIARAYLALRRGNPEEALGILEELVQIEENPFQASTFFLIGQVHMELGNPQAAREALEQAIAHEPFPWLMMQIENRLDR
jgi:serine/threonine protein kinase/tetratricopeptide (TPR) repeat protein